MNYPSGKKITFGDPVWWNEGVNVGRVSLVVEKDEQCKQWGLEAPGVFVCFDFSGKKMTEDACTPEKDLEGEGFERMTVAEEAEINELYARLCLVHPEAKDYSFTVLCHKASEGIKWILELFRGPSETKRFYAVYEGSTEFVAISEKEV